jgi:4-amino-4-deoxy-L-arabinose transferase-like glycosyltransferase
MLRRPRPARQDRHSAPSPAGRPAPPIATGDGARRRERWLLLGIVLAAGALRIWHLDQGLPDFLEEAIPFRRALDMWPWSGGRLDLDPHFYNYPSLTIYLHWLLQSLHMLAGRLLGAFGSPADYWLQFHLDPTAPVLLARLPGVLADLGAVVAAWRLGQTLRRGAGWLAAALLAVSPALVEEARLIQPDSILMVCTIWALERMVAYARQGGRRRLVMAVVLTGLAAGAKYPGAFLVFPLAWALWAHRGKAGLREWPTAAAGALAVFLLTSPFILLDAGTFWHDLQFEAQHMAAGHLGTIGRHGGLFLLRTLAIQLGWAGLLLLAASFLRLLLRLLRRPPLPGGTPSHRPPAGRPQILRGPELALWVLLLPLGASIAWSRMEAVRYLLPLLPPSAVLVAAATVGLGDWLVARLALARRAARSSPSGRPTAAPRGTSRPPGPGHAPRPLVWVLALLILLPPAWSGLQTAAAGADHTRQQARRWLEANLADDDVVVLEAYTADLPNRYDRAAVADQPPFAAAAQSLQEAWLARPTYRSHALPMAASGAWSLVIPADGGPPRRLDIVGHASQLNAIYYEPALYDGVDWFVVSDAMRLRYRRDPHRYATEERFYALLETQAQVAAVFAPHGGTVGPRVTVYRLGQDFPGRLAPEQAVLDPFWWTRVIPAEVRRQVESLLPEEKRTGGAPVQPDGRPAAWVRALAGPAEQALVPFLLPLARDLTEVSRWRAGRRLSAALLATLPDQEQAALLFGICSAELGDWSTAERAVAQTLSALARDGRDSPRLRLEHARLLVHLDQPEEARREITRVLAAVEPASELARQARMLEAGP